MHHFFVTPEQVRENHIWIQGTDVNHIKNVLRMKIGEELEISDGNNQKYLCEIVLLETDSICVLIKENLVSDTELPSKLYLFQGLPKSDKMEYIVQKAVELGAFEIIPVATKRAVVKLDDKKAAKKVERWNAISEGGAKQSGRNIVPKVTRVMSYKEALTYAKQLDVVLIPYELAEGMEETRQVIDSIMPGKTVGIFIGPEGGFTDKEEQSLLSNDFKPVSLGKRVMRVETAAMYVASVINYICEG